MAAPAVAAGSLQFGRVIRRTFEVLGRNWLTLAGCSLLFTAVPDMLIERGHVWLALPKARAGIWLDIGYSLAAQLMPYSLAAAAAVLVVAGDTDGRRLDLSAALGGSIAALPRVLPSYALVVLGVLCGMALLVVPGIIAALAWLVALPVATLERRWGWSALKRSNQLTGQRRAEIFGINLAVGVVFGLIGFCSVIVAKTLGVPADAHGWPMIVTGAALKSISEPFGVVLAAVLYFELRRIHEGLDPGEAAVFD